MMLYNNEYYNKNSKVIWYPDKNLNAYICFRKTVDINEDIKKAEIKIFANSKYILYINGKYVKRGIYPNDEVFQQFDIVDVSSYLKNGKNAVCILCAPAITGDSMLFMEADIEFVSGKKSFFVVDKTFKCNVCSAYKPGIILNACDYSEIFDNREYSADWLSEEFDDTGWYNCSERKLNSTSVLNITLREINVKESIQKARAIVSAGSGNEVSTEIPILKQVKKEIGTVKAGTLYVIGTDCEIKPLDKGYFSYLLIDVEKTLTGLVKIDVNGYSSDVIDVCFAKEIKDGLPIVESVSRFILEDGNNVLETKFTENTFRYMFIIFRNYIRANKVNDISVIKREPDINIKEAYKDEAYKEIIGSVMNCASDYLYNPDKKQDFQSGTRIARAIYLCSDDIKYMEQLLVTFINCQNADGLIPEYAPSLSKTYNAEDTLDLINEIYSYYMISKNRDFLMKTYNKILFAYNWFLRFENEKLLLENVKYNDEYKLDAMLNIKYYRAVDAIRKISRLLGEKDVYVKLSKKLPKIKRNILKVFYNSKESMFERYIDEQPCEFISKNVNVIALNVMFNRKSKKAHKIANRVFINNTEKEVHALSSYYISDFVYALKRQKLETIIENELSDRDDYIASCSFIEFK